MTPLSMTPLSGMIGFIIIAIVLFFVLRQFFTWYWKINKIIEEQEKTNSLLKQMVNFHMHGKLTDPVEGKEVLSKKE